jgi:hypothetical protein
VECFRLQVSVAAQHFPILVPGDKCDLFNGKPSLEKTARSFVSEIVEMEIFDFQFAAFTPKCRADRTSVVRKNPAFANI